MENYIGNFNSHKKTYGRGIDCNTRCSICGAKEESVNHVIFGCHMALQTWALSKISSHPGLFLTTSIFININYFFWRLLQDYDFSYFS